MGSGSFGIQQPLTSGTLLLHPLSYQSALEAQIHFTSVAEQLPTSLKGLAPDATPGPQENFLPRLF